MSKYLLVFSFLFFHTFLPAQGATGALKSPDQFLQYNLGSRFTPHYLLVEYFRYMAANSSKIKLVEFGKTYEMRPMIAAIISSPQNIARVEEIRMNNMRRTGLESGAVKKENIAIVYLSYSVHGNEVAGSESSMKVLYDLVSGGGDIDQWLNNTIVIIDPSLNPDGYARYTEWSNRVSNFPNNPNPDAREHHEPWPGGRVNHFYFDLNRDWAWQTQQESRNRSAFYQQWMPQVHVDLHEMSSESPYFFAPAAEPFGPYVTAFQKSFQSEIGKNNAAYFDKNGWRYYTKENYDLFYPSYGDTYPTYSGAIGMTYEEGGGGYSNRAVITQNGDTLTLGDRIAHHAASSMATIETTSKHAGELVTQFETYFDNSMHHPPGVYNSYVISQSNSQGRMHDLMTLLDRNKIQYGISKDNRNAIKAFNYGSGENNDFSLMKGDLIIPCAQPRAVLLKSMFDPELYLSDSMTYDISAWSIPMAFGLTAYATEDKIDFIPYASSPTSRMEAEAHPYAYALEWGSVPSAALLSKFLSEGIVARYAKYPFTVNNHNYLSGTILLMRADNRKNPAFDEIIKNAISEAIVSITSISTGFVTSGKDLGSDSYPLVRIPKVLSVAGERVSSQSIGQIWHYFEEELKYTVNLILPDDLEDVNLSDYNVLVLPEGGYELDTDFMSKVRSWMVSGGRLIAMGSAVSRLSSKDGFSIKPKPEPEEPDSENVKSKPIPLPDEYGTSDRKALSEDIGGAVFQTRMDSTNPLCFGLGKYYMTLKTTPSSYEWLKGTGNAIYFSENQKHYGFVGSKAIRKIDNSLVAGVEEIGNGSVVYLIDNPLFRSFWNSGKVLFSNALFF